MACRGVGYSNAEDVILFESFLEITQDPIIGRYQSSNRFLGTCRRGVQWTNGQQL